MTDKLKYAAVAAFVILGFVAYYMLEAPWSWVSLLAGIALAVIVFLVSETGRRFIVYAKDSIVETKKVVWPTRKETIQTTLIVFAFVFCMAFYLWVVNAGLGWVIDDLILGWNK